MSPFLFYAIAIEALYQHDLQVEGFTDTDANRHNWYAVNQPHKHFFEGEI